MIAGELEYDEDEDEVSDEDEDEVRDQVRDEVSDEDEDEDAQAIEVSRRDSSHCVVFLGVELLDQATYYKNIFILS